MLIHLEFFPLTAFFPLRYTNGALTAFDTFGGVGHISSTLWSLAFPRNDVPSVFIVLSSCSRPHVVIPMGLSSGPVSQQSLSLCLFLSLSLSLRHQRVSNNETSLSDSCSLIVLCKLPQTTVGRTTSSLLVSIALTAPPPHTHSLRLSLHLLFFSHTLTLTKEKREENTKCLNVRVQWSQWLKRVFGFTAQLSKASEDQWEHERRMKMMLVYK